jgi:hypothetical protein
MQLEIAKISAKMGSDGNLGLYELAKVSNGNKP